MFTDIEDRTSPESENSTIEKDQTDKNEEFPLRIDSTETRDNRSVGTNLTNNETKGVHLEEPLDAVAEDSLMEDMEIEMDGGGGEVNDLGNIDQIHESMGSPFDATFSPQRNKSRSLLASSFFISFATF